MSTKFLRSSAAALALFAGGAAFAQQAQAPAAGAAPQQQQQQQPQGPVKANLVPVQPEWTKVCGGDPQSQKEVCYTTRDFGLQADQPILALAVYDPKGAPEKVIRLLLPPGLLLKPGFRFSIDKGPQETGAFEICFPNGCFAEAKVKPATVDSMKKAEKMAVVVKNQVNNEVTFVLPLANFRQGLRRSGDRSEGSGGAPEEAPGRHGEEGAPKSAASWTPARAAPRRPTPAGKAPAGK